MHEIEQTKRLGLKHALQRGEIHDHHLAEEAAGDRVVEHAVAKELDLAVEDGLGLGAAGEGVEHVEEHEAGEGHGGVARRDLVVVAHLAVVGGEGAEHDDGGRLQDALDEGPREDARLARARGARHYGWVDGFDAEGLRGGAVHEDVWRR